MTSRRYSGRRADCCSAYSWTRNRVRRISSSLVAICFARSDGAGGDPVGPSAIIAVRRRDRGRAERRRRPGLSGSGLSERSAPDSDFVAGASGDGGWRLPRRDASRASDPEGAEAGSLPRSRNLGDSRQGDAEHRADERPAGAAGPCEEFTGCDRSKPAGGIGSSDTLRCWLARLTILRTICGWWPYACRIRWPNALFRSRRRRTDSKAAYRLEAATPGCG